MFNRNKKVINNHAIRKRLNIIMKQIALCMKIQFILKAKRKMNREPSKGNLLSQNPSL